MVKSNLGGRRRPRCSGWPTGGVEWVAEEGWLAPEDVRAVGEPSQVAWLRDQLAARAEEDESLLAEAQVLGMSMRTLQRAKQAIQVVSKRYFGAWYWCLPGQDPRQRYSGLEPVEDTELQKATPGWARSRRRSRWSRWPTARAWGRCGRTWASGRSCGGRGRRRGRQWRRAASADLSPPAGVPGARRGERGRGGDNGGGSDRACESRLAPLSPASGGEGGPSCRRCLELRPAPSPLRSGDAGRGRRVRGEATGQSSLRPGPGRTLDVVIRIGDADADWGAAVADRLADFDELVKFHLGESAGLDWEPAWTGFVGAGRLRLVLAPRQIPADRLPALERGRGSRWARASRPGWRREPTRRRGRWNREAEALGAESAASSARQSRARSGTERRAVQRSQRPTSGRSEPRTERNGAKRSGAE